MIRLFYILFSLSMCIQSLKAQQKTDNYFNQLHIGFGYLPVVSMYSPTLEYSPTNMLRFTLGTNYGNGVFKTNFLYGKMIYPTNKLPNCDVYNVNLAYQYYVRLYKRLNVYGGIETGLHTIKFDINLPNYARIETEMAAGAEIGLEAKLTPHISLNAGYRIQRIFSIPRVDFTFADVGVIYYFNKSDKIKQWLQ